MDTSDVGSKEGKKVNVCFPMPDASPEERAVAITIIDNYLSYYGGKENSD